MDPNLALVHGPQEPQLCLKTMKALIDDQASRYGDCPAVVFPWQSVRLSYRELADRSKILAKAMLKMGLGHGDCVGIMAGNCYQYIEVFLGAARIGCPVVVLNNTYTPAELTNAVRRSCKWKWCSTCELQPLTTFSMQTCFPCNEYRLARLDGSHRNSARNAMPKPSAT